MTRKATLLIAGCVLLFLVILAIRNASKTSYYAEGRILLRLNWTNFAYPTNEPARLDLDDKVMRWWTNVSDAISERLREPADKSVPSNGSFVHAPDARFAGVYGIRGTSLLRIRYAGNDKDEVWCAASNACAILTQFYSTNRPFVIQGTNEMSCEVEYIDTNFWTPKPLWEQALDWVRELIPW